MKARKRLLKVAILFFCSLSIVGTGFALWDFDREDPMIRLTASVDISGMAYNGKLEILHENHASIYDEHRLILEQRESLYHQSETGVYFVPEIDIQYTDFLLTNNVKTFLVGEVEFNNSALLDYIEAQNWLSYDGQKTYRFMREEQDIDLQQSVHFMSALPLFQYKEGMDPRTSDLYQEMVQKIKNASLNLSPGEADVSMKFTIELEEVATI